jgi:hypothetical protein
VKESSQPPPPSTGEGRSPTGCGHTHTIVSDLGGGIVSIPFLTAEQAAAYEDQQNGQDRHG